MGKYVYIYCLKCGDGYLKWDEERQAYICLSCGRETKEGE